MSMLYSQLVSAAPEWPKNVPLYVWLVSVFSIEYTIGQFFSAVSTSAEYSSKYFISCVMHYHAQVFSFKSKQLLKVLTWTMTNCYEFCLRYFFMYLIISIICCQSSRMNIHSFTLTQLSGFDNNFVPPCPEGIKTSMIL